MDFLIDSITRKNTRISFFYLTVYFSIFTNGNAAALTGIVINDSAAANCYITG